MTAHCREALARDYERHRRPPLATLVSFVPPGDPAETVAALYERGVVVRELPGTGWVRASCGWWTNEDDVSVVRKPKGGAQADAAAPAEPAEAAAAPAKPAEPAE